MPFFLTSGLVSMLIPELVKSVLSLYVSLPDTINQSYDNLTVILQRFPDVRPYVEKAYEELSNFSPENPIIHRQSFPTCKTLPLSLPTESGIPLP